MTHADAYLWQHKRRKRLYRRLKLQQWHIRADLLFCACVATHSIPYLSFHPFLYLDSEGHPIPGQSYLRREVVFLLTSNGAIFKMI